MHRREGPRPTTTKHPSSTAETRMGASERHTFHENLSLYAREDMNQAYVFLFEKGPGDIRKIQRKWSIMQGGSKEYSITRLMGFLYDRVAHGGILRL